MNASAFARLTAVLALATACAPKPAAPPHPDENAIRAALNAQLAKLAPAGAAKDAAAMANLFTEDGTWIAEDASTFTGRASIEAAAKKFFETAESFTLDQMAIDKLIVVNDSEAVTFSHGNYTLTEKGKKPAKHLNPFADYWKKGADGVWRIAYEVNADGPAPAAAPAKR
jgi:uncharacterized protein (TIGR02246 family)